MFFQKRYECVYVSNNNNFILHVRLRKNIVNEDMLQ